MKYLLAVMTLSALIAFPSRAQEPGTAVSKPEQQLREIEEARRKAIRQGDMKMLDTIYSDDFSGIVGSGQVINKEQLFAAFKRNDPRVTFTTDEITVRIYGNTAIFTGRLIGKSADGAVTSAARFTHIFVKRAGRWQCVAGQSTVLPKQS